LVFKTKSDDEKTPKFLCIKCGQELTPKDKVSMNLGQRSKAWHALACPPKPTPASPDASDVADTDDKKPRQNPGKFD
jgi:hypothetical protein